MQVHLFILVVLIFLNIVPEKFIDRKKYILPISFLIIMIYWSIRYDYGLDYWSYMESFYKGTNEKNIGFGERWFYVLFNSFERYYQFIITQSLIIVLSLYYIVKKYIATNSYWLFFFLLFAVTGLHFNLISAIRSSMAACILYWAFDLCYITKKRWLLYILLVLSAAQFHTSALVFLFLPLIHLSLNYSNSRTIFVTLILSNILSMFFVNFLFVNIVSISSLTGVYADSYSEIMKESNLNGVIFKSVILLPTYYILKVYNNLNDKNDSIRRIIILALFYLFLDMLNLNFQGRFTVYLFPFFIISLSIAKKHLSKNNTIKMLFPYLIVVIYSLYLYYVSLLENITGRWSEGNPYFYKTIFDAPYLP